MVAERRLCAMPDEQTRQDYLAAYRGWMEQISGVHKVLLEGERLVPPQLKGLLNREARAKLRYDAARRRLLGIPGDAPEVVEEGDG